MFLNIQIFDSGIHNKVELMHQNGRTLETKLNGSHYQLKCSDSSSDHFGHHSHIEGYTMVKFNASN